MNVYAIPEVIEDLENLIDILFEKGYFGFEDKSVNYVVSLFEDIKNNLPKKLKKPAPEYFSDRYGKGLYYVTFKKNNRTQWYVFFRMYRMDEELYYQVRYITNNHTAAHHLHRD